VCQDARDGVGDIVMPAWRMVDRLSAAPRGATLQGAQLREDTGLIEQFRLTTVLVVACTSQTRDEPAEDATGNQFDLSERET